jgi:branched-chain amino acid transport system permease protein
LALEFFIQLLNGIQYGLLLFLLASGLSLIFGIMGVLNLAHGSFYMVGAYLAFWLAREIGNLWLAIPIELAMVLLIGVILESALFSRLYHRDHLQQVLLSFGLILIFEELRSILFGDDVHSVPVPPLLRPSIPLTGTLSYPVYRLFISGACLVVAGLMYLVIQKTRIGMIIRAGSTNREMVESLGINIKLIYRWVFAVGVTLAAFAGLIAAPVSSVYPGMGSQILIICFVVVVVGGIGSIKGAMISSLIIGIVDTLGQVVLPEFSGVAVYLLMAVILLWRPQGLFRVA